MYTIFFTINCVEQLTFSKTFVDQLQFEQLICFLSKSETAWNTRTADDFWFSTSFHFFCQLLDLRRAVDIFVSTSFFELSNFKQLIISCQFVLTFSLNLFYISFWFLLNFILISFKFQFKSVYSILVCFKFQFKFALNLFYISFWFVFPFTLLKRWKCWLASL